MAETLNTRVTRLENLVGILADKEAKLDVMRALAESQIKLHEDIRELRQEQGEHDRKIDDRIEKLVQAIAELSRNRQN